MAANLSINHPLTLRHGVITAGRARQMADAFRTEALRAEEPGDPQIASGQITPDAVEQGIRLAAMSSLHCWGLALHHGTTDSDAIMQQKQVGPSTPSAEDRQRLPWSSERVSMRSMQRVDSTNVLTADPADAVVDLTGRLVAFDSVNPGLVPGAVGEGPAARFVADRLSGSGFEVQLVPTPSDPRRMSVIAVRDGGQPRRTVVLNGHLGTVGVDGMTEPFTARIDGGRMLGRGACDMKGGVAGLAVAAEQLAADGAPGRLVLALVADEEDASLGAAAVLEALSVSAVQPDVCLVAEPTWMESALWQASGVPAVVCGPAGGGLHAVDEWVDLAQLRRYPVAVASAVGRFLAGAAS